jgi:FHA domain
MPHDPFGDLESLFSEGDLGVTRGAGAPKGGYTPTRKEAVVRDEVKTPPPLTQEPEKPGSPAGRSPTRLEPLPLFRAGDRLATRAEQVVEDTAPFKPTRRPPMALLCYLDDGSEDGEWFRVRTDKFVIGRTEGDLLVPHDGLVSPRHAEITRTLENSKHVWHLTDLHSEAGTFVAVPERPLKHGMELWLGTRRYRFEQQEGGAAPVLAEIGGERRIVLDPPAVDFGRAMVPVDPCLGKPHCRFEGGADGKWKVVNLGSRNGIWVRTDRVRFVANCRFQIGEQRFYVEVVP